VVSVASVSPLKIVARSATGELFKLALLDCTTTPMDATGAGAANAETASTVTAMTAKIPDFINMRTMRLHQGLHSRYGVGKNASMAIFFRGSDRNS
jgi:hypothetical protein